MKVLFISNDAGIADAQSAVRERMRNYAEAIGELTIVLRGRKTQTETDGNLTIHQVRCSKLFAPFVLGDYARELVEKRGIELVSTQDPFEFGIAGVRATKDTAALLHIQVHTDFLSPWFVRAKNYRSAQVKMPLLNRVRVRIADWVLPQAHGIRVVSERIRHSLIERYGEGLAPISVIPVAVEVADCEPVPFPEHAFRYNLLTVGRLEPEKRIEDILHALARVAHRYPMIGLMVVGEGRERKRLQKMATTLGLSQRVQFLGARRDVCGLMKSAQAYIQASAYEGYGRTLIEAAMAELPIITTDVGIVGEVLRGYEEVLPAPVGDSTQLSVHIVRLIEDVATAELLSRQAKLRVAEHLAGTGDIPSRIAEDLSGVIAGKK